MLNENDLYTLYNSLFLQYLTLRTEVLSITYKSTAIFMDKIYYRKMSLRILDYFTYSNNVHNVMKCYS